MEKDTGQRTVHCFTLDTIFVCWYLRGDDRDEICYQDDLNFYTFRRSRVYGNADFWKSDRECQTGCIMGGICQSDDIRSTWHN